MKKAAIIPTIVIFIMLLVSCAPHVAISLSPDALGLEPAIRSHIKTWDAQGGVVHDLILPGQTPAPDAALIIYIETDATIDQTTIQLPQNLATIQMLPATLRGVAQAPNGSFNFVPLFWDVWGVTTFDSLSAPTVEKRDFVEWDSLLAKKTGPRVQLVGSSPQARSLAWHVSKENERNMASLVRQPIWQTDTWFYTEGDVSNQYKSLSPFYFIETLRTFIQKNPTGQRHFKVIAHGNSDSVTVYGMLLVARFVGTKDTIQFGEAAINGLLSVDVQKEISMKSGWLPANLQTPAVNPENAQAGKVIALASQFVQTGNPSSDEQKITRLIIQDPTKFQK